MVISVLWVKGEECTVVKGCECFLRVTSDAEVRRLSFIMLKSANRCCKHRPLKAAAGVLCVVYITEGVFFPVSISLQ